MTDATPKVTVSNLNSLHYLHYLNIIDFPVMDFAPYQDTAPEHERSLSPPPRRSTSRSPVPKSPPPNQNSTDPFSSSALPPPSHFGGDVRSGFGADVEGGRSNINLFETSLPIRLDYEAMLAYLLLPPAGGVVLLVMEHKSDYVRCVPILRVSG